MVPSSEELEEGTRSRVPRGQAQERLHDACARLLAGVTLDDLTAFVTVARLTQESGVSSGAIYSAVDGGVGSALLLSLVDPKLLPVTTDSATKPIPAKVKTNINVVTTNVPNF